MTEQVQGLHEAEALPLWSVIRMKEGRIYRHDDNGWRDFYGVVWLTPGWDYPATVIHREE